MIPSFSEVMAFTRTISSETAFDDVECRAYYDLAVALRPESTIVEIGLQYGRSSSIVLQVAKANGHVYWGIDPFTQPPEAKAAWQTLKYTINYPVWLIEAESGELGTHSWPFPIHLALIDGDHSEQGVRIDCGIVLPRMAVGGHVCFHDYQRDSLPGVQAAVDGCVTDNFTHVGLYGSLGVWRKES